MTIDELKAIPFHFVCSAAWEDEHTLTYESEDGRLGYCDHTPKRKNYNSTVSKMKEDAASGVDTEKDGLTKLLVEARDSMNEVPEL